MCTNLFRIDFSQCCEEWAVCREKQLKHLDTGKATGIDNVSAKYYKMSGIKSNSFPTLFKTAKVVPIYEKGDKSVMSYYRPI